MHCEQGGKVGGFGRKRFEREFEEALERCLPRKLRIAGIESLNDRFHQEGVPVGQDNELAGGLLVDIGEEEQQDVHHAFVADFGELHSEQNALALELVEQGHTARRRNDRVECRDESRREKRLVVYGAREHLKGGCVGIVDVVAHEKKMAIRAQNAEKVLDGFLNLRGREGERGCGAFGIDVDRGNKAAQAPPLLVAHDSLRAQGYFGPVGGGGKPFDRINEAAKRYLARLLSEFYDDAPLARLVRKLLEEAGFADSRFACDKHE